MWLHIMVLAGVVILYVYGRMGKIPYKKYVDKKEWNKILLIILIGNLLGASLTWQDNHHRSLGEEAYLDRPGSDEGNKSYTFQINADENSYEVTLNVPASPGEESGEADHNKADIKTEEEVFIEKVLEEVEALNEEKKDNKKYYLPSEIAGTNIYWYYPRQIRGNMMVALVLLAGILLFIRRENQNQENMKKRREQLMIDYPDLVTKMGLLMEAGMSMRRAFSKTALDYKKYRERDAPERIAYEEMLATYYEMESGVLEEDAYENFGRRCNNPRYRALATLMVQNLRRGSQGLIDMLEREGAMAFEDRKRQARILGEAATTKLLFPMLLMLLVVLAILMVPAFLSFSV